MARLWTLGIAQDNSPLCALSGILSTSSPQYYELYFSLHMAVNSFFFFCSSLPFHLILRKPILDKKTNLVPLGRAAEPSEVNATGTRPKDGERPGTLTRLPLGVE